jgi:hypothetical protein
MPPTTHSLLRLALGDARDFLVSMKLTMVLLGLSMVLIFAATIDQVNLGIWAVQEKYFRSFFVYMPVGRLLVPVFPGGYAVGGLLLLNLLAAHVYRFALTWRKAGIQLVHAGLIVLLLGELLTGLWQRDAHMRLSMGETKNFAESFRDHELVIGDTTDPAFDEVVAIPASRLAIKEEIQHPRLPFRLRARSYYHNSTLVTRTAGAAPAGVEHASSGVGDHIAAMPQEVTYRPNEQNVPSAIVEVSGAGGPLGTWLVSPQLPMPQEFRHADRTWTIALRVRRTYVPFSLTLLKFSHDRYAGTEIPKNFSSLLRLSTPGGGDDREVLIYMNNPLRHAGLTFYQSGFENDDRTTILQVVSNPSWLMPYVACSMMTLGLTVQFGWHLLAFIRKRRASAPATVASVGVRPPRSARVIPAP